MYPPDSMLSGYDATGSYIRGVYRSVGLHCTAAINKKEYTKHISPAAINKRERDRTFPADIIVRGSSIFPEINTIVKFCFHCAHQRYLSKLLRLVSLCT